MKKYRFWFDDEHYGISVGNSINDAFQYFLNFGFDYTDVEKVEVEE